MKKYFYNVQFDVVAPHGTTQKFAWGFIRTHNLGDKLLDELLELVSPQFAFPIQNINLTAFSRV